MNFKTSMMVVLALLFLTVTVAQGMAQEGTTQDTQSSMRPLALYKAGGALKKAKFWFEDTWSYNSSTTVFENLFDVDFKLKGTRRQCIQITYSGEFSIEGSGTKQGQYQILVDNIVLWDSYVTGSFPAYIDQLTVVEYACGLISGGATHNIKVRHRLNQGNSNNVGERKLIVEYKK